MLTPSLNTALCIETVNLQGYLLFPIVDMDREIAIYGYLIRSVQMVVNSHCLLNGRLHAGNVKLAFCPDFGKIVLLTSSIRWKYSLIVP